jgi:hypothetical protein
MRQKSEPEKQPAKDAIRVGLSRAHAMRIERVFVKVLPALKVVGYRRSALPRRRRCQSNGGLSTCSATAISRAAIYAARARHSAKAAERLCL